jgi:uncharacterized protein YcbX
MSTGAVTAIHLHPVKACHRVEVDQAVLGPRGFEGDREWQVIGTDGKPLTQRTHPVMATIQPRLLADGIELSAPGVESIRVRRPPNADSEVRAALGERVRAADAGDDVADWLEEVLEDGCRLVAIAAGYSRRVKIFDQEAAFGDAAPVCVANEASWRDLAARAREPFGIERFRPNLIVDAGEPWVEDTWLGFSVGLATLRTAMPWPRCAVPQVDQETGERRREPALALRAHRWCAEAPGYSDVLRPFLEGSPLFAIGCSASPAGVTLSVGDPVVVHETMEPLIPAPAAVS